MNQGGQDTMAGNRHFQQASFYLHSKHLFWEIHIKHYYLYKNGLNFHNAYNPQKAILIDLDEGFFIVLFSFFFLQKKKSDYKGESGVSCSRYELEEKKSLRWHLQKCLTQEIFLPFQSFNT